MAQSGYFNGAVLDSTTADPVQFAHIMNLSGKSQDISDVNGKFQIVGNVGDTILISIVGYQKMGWIIEQDWFDKEVKLKLPQDTILLEGVVVNEMPTEEIFKQRILNYQPEDTSFWYYGMPEPVTKEDMTLNEKVIRNPLYIAAHPLTAAYYNLSKQEKERRKYHKIQTSELQQNRVYQKFTRDWVEDVTGLQGDELTRFITFCDYSLSYLDKTPLYLIQEDMIAKLQEFRKNQNG